VETDVAILGGGVAGLWLLNRLRQDGYEALLFDPGDLGAGQSVVSQGMIHGGIKYALHGRPGGALDAIADMPELWRRCLRGEGPLDLRETRVLSDHYYMWSGAGLPSKLTAFLGSQAIRGRVDRVARADVPPFFAHPAFGGSLYRLQDLVIDVPSLLANLLRRQRGRVHLAGDPDGGRMVMDSQGRVAGLMAAPGVEVRAACYVLAAGAGNETLLRQAGIDVPMQRRPLHQVFVRHRHPHPLFAHCVGTGAVPRVTVTTHPADGGGAVWNLGGDLAETGVVRTGQEQIGRARDLLAEVLPWVDLDGAEWACHRVDRAEPATPGAARPDTAWATRRGNLVVAWPVKLTLVPQLAERVVALLREGSAKISPRAGPAPALPLPEPRVARPPWLDAFT
jgi:glycerol-3-phosphate dehydrogenase